MTIRDAISQVDSRLTNIFPQKDKIEWLSQLDMRIKTQILDTHEGAQQVDFHGYTENTNQNTVLLVAAPYDEMYLRHLEAMIHYYNKEEERCNNATDAFNVLYREFFNYYNRSHMPKGRKLSV